MGKLLRVNLTTRVCCDESLPDERTLKLYVGGWGLGLRMLSDMLPLGIHPHDPENLLIMLTGPLTATSVPAATNLTVTTLNAETGFTAGRSHTHGWFGPMLKFAGYDGVVIEGASKTPVYLAIQEHGGTIASADNLWGLDTHETGEALKAEFPGTSTSVMAIGPAGENLCAGAIAANDKNHSCSHSGIGSIMGSKKLKAIVVQGGSHQVHIADPERFKSVAAEWKAGLFDEQGTLRVDVGRAGVPRGEYKWLKEKVGLVGYNFQTAEMEEFGKGMGEQDITVQPCWQCPIACSYDVKIKDGPYAGHVATLCGGGENLEGAGSILGVTDAGSVFYLTDLCDRLGIETSVAGCSLGVAFEAFEKGLLSEKDTDGLVLEWGNAEVIETCLRKMAHREGFGAVLADGIRSAGQRVGLPESAVHLKGASINLHDWRAVWGMFLGQVTGGGSGWPAPGADYRREPNIGIMEATARFDPSIKPKEVRDGGMFKFGYADTLGAGWFAYWNIPHAAEWAAHALSALTGQVYTVDEIFDVGEREMNLERVFSIVRGHTPEDDKAIPEKLLQAPDNGPAKGVSIRPYIDGMIDDYYVAMGWDKKTSKPLRSTLRRLQLDEEIVTLWGREE